MPENMVGLLLDTSIFDAHGLKLESGLLGRLKQFKDEPTYIVIPDVVKNEVLQHLNQKILGTRRNLEKAIREASDHWFYEGSSLNSAKEILLKDENIENLAKERFLAFENSCDAWILESEQFVSVGELLGCYFSSKPPFSEKGRKKNEFPDAIALLAAERFAKQKRIRLYAVSRDNDWKNFCDHCETIDYYTDLADALNDLHMHTVPLTLKNDFCTLITRQDSSPLIDKIKAYINDHIESNCTIDAYVTGEDALEGDVSSLELEVCDNEIGSDVDIVEVFSSNHISFEISSTITVDITAEIDISTYNPSIDDYTVISQQDAATTETITCTALVSLKVEGDDLDSAILENIEVSFSAPSISFSIDSTPSYYEE
ncbi:DUF4935 domain-containing protein [Vibrio parahaemolyticus]|nr:DUF4935 domain-containing protein [Vibrio parahaemolyticus]